MGFEKEKIKQIRGLVLFVAAIVLVILYSDRVFVWLGFFMSILAPFIAGGAIAFVLNLPLRGIENKLLKRWKGKVANRIKRPVSVVLSIVFIVAIVAFVVVTVVPKLQETVILLGQQIPLFIRNIGKELEKLTADNPQLSEWLNQLEELTVDWNSILGSVGGFLSTGMSNVISSAYNVASSIVGGVVNAFIAIIFAIYVLFQKEKLANQGHRILKAYLPGRACAGIEHVLVLLHRNFSNFITGQCVEAVILGSMFVIAMSILQFPYAVLIGVLIAFMALIPIVGAFIGCVVGAFLILMNDPLQAVWFVVLFLVIQQIEGNLIYPHVVGNSVGLPSMWVLVAVTLGGSLFGIVGMLCFIPLVATAYALIRESVNRRNLRRQCADVVEEVSESSPVQRGESEVLPSAQEKEEESV